MTIFFGAYAANKFVRLAPTVVAMLVSRLRRNLSTFDLPIKTTSKRERPRICCEKHVVCGQLVYAE